MALLQVYKDQQLVKEFEIQPHKEWILGRSDSVDLVLEGERGISRQHLKLRCVDGEWQAENLSRYGELYQNSKKTGLITLNDGDRFEIPPFDFVFVDGRPSQSSEKMDSLSMAESNEIDERTRVGQVEHCPYLKVCDSQGEVVQVFKLEGHVWVAGRDTSCALFIDNRKFSRRHFEIRFDEGSYLIRDLNSANGTVLNGELISTSDWAVLKSGDVLNVVDWTLFFELRDAYFENKLQEVPLELRNPDVFEEEQVPSPLSFATFSPDSPPQLMAELKSPKRKLNVVQVLIGVILIGALAFYFSEESPKAPSVADQKKLAPFEKLTPEQQQYVKDKYRLAEKLYKESRFELSRQELIKLHDVIPSYESSLELAKFAEIGFQTQQEQLKAQQEEQVRAEMENKIQQVVSDCRSKLDQDIDMAEIDECLMPAIALNPEHPEIVSLKSKVDQMISEKMQKAHKRAEYQSLVKRQQALYQKAAALAKAGKPLDAIPAFESVLASKLPDPKNLKGEAKRQIASIQKKLTHAQAKFESVADQAAKKGDLKTAILTLRKAIEVNPNNESLQGRANSLLSELRKQMQVLYQEGVLEESVGEVETAKGKWRKIMEHSIPDEDYYKKAHSKLKKYGAE